MTRTCSQMHCTDKYSQHGSIIWPVSLNGRALVHERSDCELDSKRSNLNFRLQPVCSEEFLDLQATIKCGITLKYVHDMARTYSQMQHTDKYLQHSSNIFRVLLNSWVFVFKVSGCGFYSGCSHLNIIFRACLKQCVPWQSGNYRMWIHFETRTWYDKTYSWMQCGDQYSKLSSIIWTRWLSGWVPVHELRGPGFKSICSHLNFRCRIWFEQEFPWHSGNYRAWILSEMRTLLDKSIQSKAPYR